MTFNSFGQSGSKKYRNQTGQLTIYHTGDNADCPKTENPPAYTVLSTGQYSGTTSVDTPHYAAATISFDQATKQIRDSSNLMGTIIAGDTIIIKNSASNNTSYTVATKIVKHYLNSKQPEEVIK